MSLINNTIESQPKKIIFIQESVPSYRMAFFRDLARREGIDLTVIASSGGKEEGFEVGLPSEAGFRWIVLKRLKFRLGGKKIIWISGMLKEIYNIQPRVIVTTGNKSFIQNHILFLLKLFLRYRIHLFQHARQYGVSSPFCKFFEKLYLKYYVEKLADGIILYTEFEKNRLIREGFNSRKLCFVNNTIDTAEIFRLSKTLNEVSIKSTLDRFKLENKTSIVFIGRLIPGKKIELLFPYYEKLKATVNDLQLIIIGDGSSREELQRRYSGLPGVVFIGRLYDENAIACIMSICRFIFLPGYSGLSVIHSFAYGKPFLTFASDDHKPEIDYVVHGGNGLILKQEESERNINIMQRLFQDMDYYGLLSEQALNTAAKHTISKMTDNFLIAIQRNS